MMEVTIGNKRLDIGDDGVSVNYTNFRFSSVIADQYTTDIDIPRTRNNDDILSAYGLLDSPTQKFGTRIRCSVSIQGTPEDGYLQVVSVQRESITVTVYLSMLPYDALDENINTMMDDVAETTIDAWNGNTQLQTIPGHWGLWQYQYGFAYMPKYAQLHPSMSVNEIMTRLGNRLGISLPTDYPSDLWILAPNKKVVPTNGKQYITWVHPSAENADCLVSGAQHVTNDCKWNSKDYGTSSCTYDDSATKLTITKDCVMHVKMYYVHHYSTSHVTVYVDGIPVQTFPLTVSDCCFTYPNTVDWTKYISFSLTLHEGDEVTVQGYVNGSDTGKHYYLWECDIASYNVNEDDYGTDMDYVRQDVQIVPTIDSPILNWVSKPSSSWCWFGYFASLPDITVRELLDSLAWITGTKLVVSGRTVSRSSSSDTRTISADIESIHPSSDKLGKVIRIAYPDTDDACFKTYFNSEWLEDDVTIHAGKLMYPHTTGMVNNGWCSFNQYSLSVDDDSVTPVKYKCEFEESDYAPVCIMMPAVSPNPAYLAVPGQIDPMGFDRIGHVVEIEGSTYDDIRGADYIIIEGHTYMLESCDTDFDTNETTFTALQINNDTARKQKAPKVWMQEVLKQEKCKANILFFYDDIPDNTMVHVLDAGMNEIGALGVSGGMFEYTFENFCPGASYIVYFRMTIGGVVYTIQVYCTIP